LATIGHTVKGWQPFFEIQLCISDVIDRLQIHVAIVLLILIGHYVIKLQKIFDIHDSGDRHLAFFKLCISDVSNLFQIEVPMFQLILVTIDQEMGAAFRIQELGSRHLEKVHFRLNHHHEK